MSQEALFPTVIPRLPPFDRLTALTGVEGRRPKDPGPVSGELTECLASLSIISGPIAASS